MILNRLTAEIARLSTFITADKHVQRQLQTATATIARETAALAKLQATLTSSEGAETRRKELQSQRIDCYERTFQAIINEQTALPAYAEQPEATIYMVTIHTKNYSEVRAFFQDKMEMEIVSENGEFAEFSSNGLRLSLAGYQTLSSFLDADSLGGERTGTGLGIGFKYALPEQVDAAYEALLAQGVQGVAVPAQQPWGEYTAFFADPDGNIHELVADTH